MITQAQYKRGPEAFWLGQRVRARHDLYNEQFVARAGTEFKIVRKRRGFTLLLAEPCKCCGLHGRISEVHPELLELVEKPPLIEAME